METFVGVEVELYVFLTSAPDGGERSALRPTHITPRKKAPRTHCIGDWVGPSGGLHAMEKRKISCLCRFSGREPWWFSQYNAYTTCWTTDESWFDFHQVKNISLFPTTSRLSLQYTHPRVKWLRIVIIPLWRWTHNVPSKCPWASTKLHGITSQNKENQNLISFECFFWLHK
jgi:hypothetical protein